MKKYSYHQIPYLSFYSRELYQDVVKAKYSVFFFLFMLLCISSLTETLWAIKGFTEFKNEYAPELIKQVPEIIIDNGKVRTTKAGPYNIIEPETGKVLLIIDTEGETKSLDNTEAFALLTQSKFIYRESKTVIKEYDLSAIPHFVINKYNIESFLQIIDEFFFPVVFVFLLAFSFLFRIYQVLIYALFGKIFAKILKVKLSYKILNNLTVIAVTPVIIISIVFSLLNIDFIGIGFVNFIIAMGYLFFGIKACAELDETQINPAS